MYEYKVLRLDVNETEDQLNQLAKEGWRLVTMVSDIARGIGVIATIEKKIV